MLRKIILENYTNLSTLRQPGLMFDYNLRVPDDSPVRLLTPPLEELDYTKLLCCCSSCGRKTRLAPIAIFKIAGLPLSKKKGNILKELFLIGMGANVRKLHNRIQSRRMGITRFALNLRIPIK